MSGQLRPGGEEGGAGRGLQGDVYWSEHHTGGQSTGTGGQREGRAGPHWGLQGRGGDTAAHCAPVRQGADAATKGLAGHHGLHMADKGKSGWQGDRLQGGCHHT